MVFAEITVKHTEIDRWDVFAVSAVGITALAVGAIIAADIAFEHT
jgi:hypothetical protein